MNTLSEISNVTERRQKPRFMCNYSALIQGFDVNGEFFQVEGRATNLSRNGVFITVNREIPFGTELSIRLAFDTKALDLGTSSLAVHGTVVRSAFQSETTYGIAVIFQDYRFI
jgi:hypothetical protein